MNEGAKRTPGRPRSAAIHFGEARLLQSPALAAEARLDMGEPSLEFGVGSAQGGFRVDVEMARQIGHDKEKSADLAFHPLRIVRGERFFDFARLLAQLGEDGVGVVPVEADFAGLFLEFHRARQSGQSEGDARQRAGRRLLGADAFGGARLGAVDALLRLDGPPQGLDLDRGQVARIGEDMRMAADEFAGDRLDDAAQIEMAGLLGEAGVKDDLQQEIAEFVAQIGKIAPVRWRRRPPRASSIVQGRWSKSFARDPTGSRSPACAGRP